MTESGSPELVFRAAEPEDTLRTTAVQWSAGWRPPSGQHRIWPEADGEWVDNNYYREFVAEVEGVIAGRVGLEAYRQPFAEEIDLCVRPEYQHRGLAQQLTRLCFREASRRGFIGVFLQTEIDNVGAHNLYHRMGFVPTAYGKMLRMFKILDYPLLYEFLRMHPLAQYSCRQLSECADCWQLHWQDYVTQDKLALLLHGGASRLESDGIGPELRAFHWSLPSDGRGLHVRFDRETIIDLEPGDFIETEITVSCEGSRPEAGIFKLLLPIGLRVSSPETNREKVFQWEVRPGETITQPVVLQIQPTFENHVLRHLNYPSVPVCMEAYWQGHRALLSVSLSMTTPKQENL